jgi:hypothetical protein
MERNERFKAKYIYGDSKYGRKGNCEHRRDKTNTARYDYRDSDGLQGKQLEEKSDQAIKVAKAKQENDIEELLVRAQIEHEELEDYPAISYGHILRTPPKKYAELEPVKSK